MASAGWVPHVHLGAGSHTGAFILLAIGCFLDLAGSSCDVTLLLLHPSCVNSSVSSLTTRGLAPPSRPAVTDLVDDQTVAINRLGMAITEDSQRNHVHSIKCWPWAAKFHANYQAT